MSWSESIRQRAGKLREALGIPEAEAVPPSRVLDSAQRRAALTVYLLAAGDPLLGGDGAQMALDRDSGAIHVSTALPLGLASLAVAHVLGHDALHGATCRCRVADLTNDGLTLAADIQSVEDSSARARREAEANLFAAELLLPRALAARLFHDRQLTASQIAQKLGLPQGLVMAQLAESALLPLPEDRAKPDAPAQRADGAWPLDASQRAAATAMPGPVLVGAGPGTGKTRTLVGRVLFLTQDLGVPASRILALTYSRKAAQEMRERIESALPDSHSRPLPWTGTFHSFGLETLRRFGDRLGLPGGELRLLDPLDCAALLENSLSRLKLDTLSNLYNPAAHLPGIVRQLSRAKDELCPPERYAQLCASMGRDAEAAEAELAERTGKILKKEIEAVEKLRSDADKACEIARCYAVYEELLREAGAVDYADLIYLTVRLLDEHPDIAQALRAEYPHILADEYQDVNRATARMLQLLAGPGGEGLWVVGDHRQSIYRFRGASPANIAAFERDYPSGKRIELGVNYRSATPVVETFAAFSNLSNFDGERQPDGWLRWTAHRGSGGGVTPCVRLAVADCDSSQSECIGSAIRKMASGSENARAYREIAVLCRTHAQAQAMSFALASQGIPALYAGDILDREEVRDVLCLMALAAGDPMPALLRAGTMPEYGLSSAEIASLTQELTEPSDAPLAERLKAALYHLDTPGAAKLDKDIERLATFAASPRKMLEAVLFDITGILRREDADAGSLAGLQTRLSLHQLLALAAAFESKPLVSGHRRANRILDFLEHLRRMRAAGESPRGSVPDSLAGLDAVRILTVHAAKGLEFPVVFLPFLGKGQFPARGRSDGLPEPTGLADAAGDDEAGEEECLFFVALSRARDLLVLSFAESSGSGKPVDISPLLARIEPWLKEQGIECVEWRSSTGEPPAATESADSPDGNARPSNSSARTYSAGELETYIDCPRRYYYERVLNLPGAPDGGAYPAFHACLRDTLRWMHERWFDGVELGSEAVEAHFTAVWAMHGPVGHPHEEQYLETARAMLRRALEIGPARGRLTGLSTIEAPLDGGGCRVRVRPDAVLEAPDGSLVYVRYRTGKQGDSDHTEPRLSVLRRAAETHGAPHRIEIHYLASGESREVEPSPRYEPARLARYEQAAAAIQRADFTPAPGDICKTCPYALICPK